MGYGDGHQAQVAKDIAEITRKMQIRMRQREKELAGSNYNAGLHTAAMLVHARITLLKDDDETRHLLEELEKAIVLAKVKDPDKCDTSECSPRKPARRSSTGG